MIRSIGVPELLIILVIVVLLFGPGRLGNVAGELGRGIRAFKEGLQGTDDNSNKEEEKTEEESESMIN